MARYTYLSSRSIFYALSVFLFYTTLSLLYFITRHTQGLKISCEVITVHVPESCPRGVATLRALFFY